MLNSIFSKETEDEVFSTFLYDGGVSAQLSVNWSDDSQRKMSTRVSLWGTNGTRPLGCMTEKSPAGP